MAQTTIPDTRTDWAVIRTLLDDMFRELYTALSQAGVSTQYSFWTDPGSSLKVRAGVRNDEYVIDKEITVTGFSGVEGTDWENIGGAQ